MFKSILLLHIVVLVTANPLQGYVSYPLIKCQEHYRNVENPLFIQPNGINSYVQLLPTQNHLTSYQNNPISYNDYGQRIYMDNNPQIQRIGFTIDPAYNVNGYVANPIDSIFLPNVLNNYITVPLKTNSKNRTTDNNEDSPKRTQGSEKLRPRNNRQNKDSKTKKRNPPTKTTHSHESPLLDKRVTREEKHHKNTGTDNVSKNNKCRNKKLKPQETEISEVNINDDRNPNSKPQNKLPDKNLNLRKISNKNDYDIPEKSAKIKTEKSKSKICENDKKISDIDDYFDINEDCFSLGNRCVRNNYKNDVKKNLQQFSYLPSDFSNHIITYMNNLMSSQYPNLNSNFPYNFEHLFNMNQFSNLNANDSQKRQRKKKRTNKRKKQKKSNKKRSDKNNKNNEQVDCEDIVELSPKLDVVEISTIISKINETDTALDEKTSLSFLSPIKTHEMIDDVSDTNAKIYVYPEITSSYTLADDSKEFHGYDLEDYTPFSNMYFSGDDYYPDFRYDFMYMNKEDYDWNNFHERNYYFCDKTGLDNCGFALLRDSIDDGIVKDDQKLNPSFERLVLQMPFESDFMGLKTELDNEGVTNLRLEEVPNNDRILEDLNEKIVFITPPGLENPDFTTKMVNKDKYSQKSEIYYQPSIEAKMSTYSDFKPTVLSGKINKFVDQNNVETNFGHSKVVKYGILQPNDEINEVINDFIDKYEEKNSDDEITTLVIAESIPHFTN